MQSVRAAAWYLAYLFFYYCTSAFKQQVCGEINILKSLKHPGSRKPITRLQQGGVGVAQIL